MERALDAAPEVAAPAEDTLDALIARRTEFLTGYQDRDYAERYRATVEGARAAETSRAPGREGFAKAVAGNAFKLMAYKDEYEVARLIIDPAFRARLEKQFEGAFRLEFHLAPPILSRPDPATGKIRKRSFGRWMMPVFRVLASLKGLRGTAFDPFGYQAERRTERRLIADYESRIAELAAALTPENHESATALARLPEQIRGYGHIKADSIEKSKQREADLLHAFRNPDAGKRAAE